MSKFKVPFIVLVVLFLVNALAWKEVYSLNQPQSLRVVFFDVGQGDSALIKTHLGHYILIDGGEGSNILEKMGQEIPFYRKDIDLVVLTHAHADHLGGLIKVLEKYQVSNILWNGVAGESSLSSKWLREISDRENIIAQSGQRIKAGDFLIDVLYPFSPLKENDFKDLNLTSVVLRASYKGKSFLFTGDIYQETEKKLIEKEEFCSDKRQEVKCQGMELESNVLKVAHHGSKTSTSKDFLEKVNPEIAVISSGLSNRCGHPHKETLEVLANYGIRVERTDFSKDIKIVVE
jgi:competence protein ComEC